MSVKDFEICPECEGEGSPSNPANCKPGSYCKRCGGTGKIMRIGNPDDLPKQLCNWCGKTTPILPNGKCLICGYDPDGKEENTATEALKPKTTMKLTITDPLTGRTYNDPALELPCTFEEFIVGFLLWKKDFDKPKTVRPDPFRNILRY